LVALVIMLGSLLFLNTWDMPTLAFLLVVIAFARNYLVAGGWRWSLLAETAGFALPLILLAGIAYAPFYFDFHTQASGLEPVEGGATRLHHALIFWGPFAVLLVPFVLWTLLRDEGRRWLTPERVRLAVAPSALILVVWAIWVLAKGGAGNLGDQLSARGANWITDLALIALLTTTILALWRELDGSGREGEQRLVVFALIASGVGALLVLGAQFFFVNDTFGSRMNTVFKLYYQAWLLLAVASALALYHLASAWLSGPATPWSWGRTWRWAWAGASGLVLVAALVYPLTATLNRTDEFGGPRGLDGLAFARRNDPDELEAVRWLADHVEGKAVVAEAVGGSYSPAGRVSAWTGIPTILGWPFHEVQWRGSFGPLEDREADVDRIFGSTDADETKDLLAKYGVSYVFVGSVERDKYPQEALDKFQDMFEVAFQQGNVTVYRVVSPVALEEMSYNRVRVENHADAG
jgi:YYY domain-containing protein